MLRKIKRLLKAMIFLASNFFGNLLITEIREMSFGDTRIIAYNNRYLDDVMDLWNSWLGPFSKIDEYLLMFYGKKTCFLMIHEDEELLGFLFFYFHFGDLLHRIIHEAAVCIVPAYRNYGYATSLFVSAYNSFKKTRWIRGISARYDLDNIPTRRLHEKCGFKAINEYYDQNLKKHRVYAICNWQ